MKVNSVNPSELLRQYAVRPKMAAEQQSSVSDKTELTEGAKTFSAALKAAQDIMDTRTSQQVDRINEVTEQIKNGTYAVSGDKVAEKIIGQ